MKIAVPFALLFATLALACSAETDVATPAPSAEDDVTARGFSGAYEGVTDNEDFLFGEVEIIRRGPKLFALLDGTEAPLTKIAPNHYEFSADDFNGECDDPGCGFIVRVAGTVTMERIDDVTRPVLKATVTEMFAHPEFEGDREGEHDTAGTWAKKL